MYYGRKNDVILKYILYNIEKSYDKFENSINVVSSYIAYDYWGLALHTHAKLKRNNPFEADNLYQLAYEKFQKSCELKPDDGYIYCHYASCLQSQAMQKEGETSVKLFELCFEKYRNSITYIPEDSYICRSWGDALHECSKKLIESTEYLDIENEPDKFYEIIDIAIKMLEEGSEKFQKAVEIRKDYTNALNSWGLLLSTQAKILRGEESDIIFAKSYGKFNEAFKYTDDEDGYVICNYAMTLVSQARKKIEGLDFNTYEELLRDSYEKIKRRLNENDTWSMFLFSEMVQCCK